MIHIKPSDELFIILTPSLISFFTKIEIPPEYLPNFFILGHIWEKSQKPWILILESSFLHVSHNTVISWELIRSIKFGSSNLGSRFSTLNDTIFNCFWSCFKSSKLIYSIFINQIFIFYFFTHFNFQTKIKDLKTTKELIPQT